jgi:hypothetical protein
MSGGKSQALELLAFDKQSTFDRVCFIWAYKANRWVLACIASELWVDCVARLNIIFANMLNSLTQTQRDTAQKGASIASKSILPAVNIQVMAPTYHGKACGSHATISSEPISINYLQMHSIQFGYLEIRLESSK